MVNFLPLDFFLFSNSFCFRKYHDTQLYFESLFRSFHFLTHFIKVSIFVFSPFSTLSQTHTHKHNFRHLINLIFNSIQFIFSACLFENEFQKQSKMINEISNRFISRFFYLKLKKTIIISSSINDNDDDNL